MRPLLVLTTALLTACASTGEGGLSTTGTTPATTQVATATGTYDINAVAESRMSSHWVRATADQLWATLPAVYDVLGIEAGIIDAAPRTARMLNPGVAD